MCFACSLLNKFCALLNLKMTPLEHYWWCKLWDFCPLFLSCLLWRSMCLWQDRKKASARGLKEAWPEVHLCGNLNGKVFRRKKKQLCLWSLRSFVKGSTEMQQFSPFPWWKKRKDFRCIVWKGLTLKQIQHANAHLAQSNNNGIYRAHSETQSTLQPNEKHANTHL